jgi:hypothetical protein
MAGNSEFIIEKVLSQSWVQTTPETDANPPEPASLEQEEKLKAKKPRQKIEKSAFIDFKNTTIGG